MPKELVPGGWVQRPCLFLQPADDDATCQLCERPFTFFNSPRHCDYCGRIFHRKDCSSKEGIWSHRVCFYCDDYRNVIQEKLLTGEKFKCVGNSQEVHISLCEETAELQLHWTAMSIKETVDLQKVELRKGFTHSGHLLNGEYEPLKSMSLFIKDEIKVLDLKSQSSWTCQLWVDGLKSAQYVYRCMLDQERTKLWYLDQGVKVEPRWFSSYYLLDSISTSTSSATTPHTVSIPRPTHTVTNAPRPTPTARDACHPLHIATSVPRPLHTASDALHPLHIATSAPRTMPRSPSRPVHTSTRFTPHTDSEHSFPSSHFHSCADSGYSSDRTPSPLKHRSSRPRQVKVHGTVSPVESIMSGSSVSSPPRAYTQSWHSQVSPHHHPLSRKSHTIHTAHALRSSHGLPYRSSPLSALCRCHDYEIVPSRSVDVSLHGHNPPPISGPGQCCGDCINTCKIAQDLDNL